MTVADTTNLNTRVEFACTGACVEQRPKLSFIEAEGVSVITSNGKTLRLIGLHHSNV
jgi:hypothetical protein